MKRIPIRALIEFARAAELLSAAGFGAVLVTGVMYPSIVSFLIGCGIVVGVITLSLWRDNLVGSRETTEENLLAAPQRTREAYDAALDAIARTAEAMTHATACVHDMSDVMLEQNADAAAVRAERDKLLRVSAHLDEIREVVSSPRRITMHGVMAESGPALPPADLDQHRHQAPNWLSETRPPGQPARVEPTVATFAPRRDRPLPDAQQFEDALRAPEPKTGT